MTGLEREMVEKPIFTIKSMAKTAEDWEKLLERLEDDLSNGRDEQLSRYFTDLVKAVSIPEEGYNRHNDETGREQEDQTTSIPKAYSTLLAKRKRDEYNAENHVATARHAPTNSPHHATKPHVLVYPPHHGQLFQDAVFAFSNTPQPLYTPAHKRARLQ